MIYGDPLKVALREESQRIGCRACEWDQKRVDGRGFHCAKGRRIWPDGGQDNCLDWSLKTENGDGNER